MVFALSACPDECYRSCTDARRSRGWHVQVEMGDCWNIAVPHRRRPRLFLRIITARFDDFNHIDDKTWKRAGFILLRCNSAAGTECKGQTRRPVNPSGQPRTAGSRLAKLTASKYLPAPEIQSPTEGVCEAENKCSRQTDLIIVGGIGIKCRNNQYASKQAN